MNKDNQRKSAFGHYSLPPLPPSSGKGGQGEWGKENHTRHRGEDIALTTNEYCIIGIDEAGRGPLAGPVVAGACYIPLPLYRRRRSHGAWSPHKRSRKNDCIIGDSKALTAEQRRTAYEWITTHCIWGVGHTSHEDIDRIGLLAATEKAMHQALRMLAEKITPTQLLVDGRDHFWFDYPHRSIIRGDDTEPAIAAASIVAKVTRDRMMVEAAQEFPQYGFERHKGYGSAEHIEAIKRHGPCPLHRRSFLRNILEQVSIG